MEFSKFGGICNVYSTDSAKSTIHKLVSVKKQYEISTCMTTSLCSSGRRTSVQHFLLHPSPTSPQWVGCLTNVVGSENTYPLCRWAETLPQSGNFGSNWVICRPENFAQDCHGKRLLQLPIRQSPILKHSLFRRPAVWRPYGCRVLISSVEH